MSTAASLATIEEIVSTAPLVIRRTVRWGECDPAGIVYTPRFLDYVVSAYEGFVSLMLGAPLHGAKAALGVDFPARAATLDFRRPLALEDRFDMALRVGALRRRSYDLHIRATPPGQPGTVAFLARISPVTVYPRSRAAVALPPALRAAIAAYAAAHPLTPEFHA